MLKFQITTPEKVLIDQEVESVTLPTEMGQITIMKNHVPLVANLVPGELKYKHNGQDTFFAVSGGFVEVKKGNKVIILADTAEFGHEINLERAEAARDRARNLMETKDQKAFGLAAALLEKNLARIKVARRHRTHTNVNLESGNLSEIK